MKISDLIRTLEAFKAERGDIDVLVKDHRFADSAHAWHDPDVSMGRRLDGKGTQVTVVKIETQ